MSDELLRSLERLERTAPDDSVAVERADRERARAGLPTLRSALLSRLAAAFDAGIPARIERVRRETNAAVNNVLLAGVRHRAGRTSVAPPETAVAIPLVTALAEAIPDLTEGEAGRVVQALLSRAARGPYELDMAQRVASEAARLARLALIDARERGEGVRPFSDASRIAFAALARAVGVFTAHRLTGREIDRTVPPFVLPEPSEPWLPEPPFRRRPE